MPIYGVEQDVYGNSLMLLTCLYKVWSRMFTAIHSCCKYVHVGFGAGCLRQFTHAADKPIYGVEQDVYGNSPMLLTYLYKVWGRMFTAIHPCC